MVAIIRWLALILLSATAAVSSEEKAKDETQYCVRWRWVGDVNERKVYCIEWAKKDCSNHLYKEICKQRGG